MDDRELAAWNGLIAGYLDPLADLLAEEREYVNPIIQRWLVKLIRGSEREIDDRIVVKRHPALKPNQRRRDGANQRQRRMALAFAFYRHGGDQEGQYYAALAEVREEFKLRPSQNSSITDAWRDFEAFVKFSVAHGLTPAADDKSRA